MKNGKKKESLMKNKKELCSKPLNKFSLAAVAFAGISYGALGIAEPLRSEVVAKQIESSSHLHTELDYYETTPEHCGYTCGTSCGKTS
jgi:hypothetical protein